MAKRRALQISGHGAGGEMYATMRANGEDLGQNRPGPEAIQWRTAMGWIDGPKSRYCLAQAVPPAYAEWVARAFLAARS